MMVFAGRLHGGSRLITSGTSYLQDVGKEREQERKLNPAITGDVKYREGGLMADRTLSPAQSLKIISFPFQRQEESAIFQRPQFAVGLAQT